MDLLLPILLLFVGLGIGGGAVWALMRTRERHAYDRGKDSTAAETVALAERLGIGSIWPAARYDFKNVEVLCGAAAAITSQIKIAPGLMNYPTHHPMELCSFGATMSHLSDNRFAMGFGRGFDALYDIFGTKRANLQGLREIPQVLRSLWNDGTLWNDDNELSEDDRLAGSVWPSAAFDRAQRHGGRQSLEACKWCVVDSRGRLPPCG